MLDLNNSRLLGKGSSRRCYVHPEDSSKCVKVTYTNDPGIAVKEMQHYRRHLRRGISWEMLARSYGVVDTNKGPGVVFSLAYDYDGEISRTFDSYLATERLTPPAPLLTSLLKELRQYMLHEHILIRELKSDNLVFQRTAPDNGRLILIDGVGNNQFLPLANYVTPLARRVITRKWQKFKRHLLNTFPDNGALRNTLAQID
ncbi:MAG: PhoP regulatory network protein YrbL [Chlorobiaceae bacterium]|nr:PhoP regulatory network protein YrbL [Chlorobiaceae bacterium]NTW75088.1 PhoP regulatory network protein YrbL [Chlorobiaceae bacterium]